MGNKDKQESEKIKRIKCYDILEELKKPELPQVGYKKHPRLTELIL